MRSFPPPALRFYRDPRLNLEAEAAKWPLPPPPARAAVKAELAAFAAFRLAARADPPLRGASQGPEPLPANPQENAAARKRAFDAMHSRLSARAGALCAAAQPRSPQLPGLSREEARERGDILWAAANAAAAAALAWQKMQTALLLAAAQPRPQPAAQKKGKRKTAPSPY